MELVGSCSYSLHSINSNSGEGQGGKFHISPNFQLEKKRSYNFRKSAQIGGMLWENLENVAIKKLAVVNASDGEAETETLLAEKPKLQGLKVFVGSPMPFGATARDGGVNFSVYSGNSTSATLCLISLLDLEEDRVTEQIHLDPLTNKTGDVWHAFLQGELFDMLYGYKFNGEFSPQEGHYYDSSRILLDPYAKAVVSRGEYGSMGPEGNCWPQMAGMVPSTNNLKCGISEFL